MPTLARLLIPLFTLLCWTASASDDRLAAAEADIRALLETQRTAMLERDASKYLSTWFPGVTGAQSVMDDQVLARAQAKNPAAKRTDMDPGASNATFIKRIVESEVPIHMTFSNVEVKTDGEVGSIACDYGYVYDGDEVGRGRSYYLVVRTEEGWKVSGAVYSKKPGKDQGKKPSR